MYVTGEKKYKSSTSIINCLVIEADELLAHALVYEIIVSKLDGFSSAFYYKMLKMKA